MPIAVRALLLPFKLIIWLLAQPIKLMAGSMRLFCVVILAALIVVGIFLYFIQRYVGLERFF